MLQPRFAAANEFGQFVGGNAGDCAAMTLTAAVAYFDEDDGLAVLGDDVDFAKATMPVAADDGTALFL